MASKKNISTNDELSIDVLQLLKKCWYFRKLIFFGTGIVVLLSLFIIIMLNQTIKSKNYTTSILRGDLGSNNSLIIDTFYSVDIVNKALKVLSLEIGANKFLDHLIVKKGTDPLAMSLKDRINSLTNKDIKKLALSNDKLSSTIEDLDDASSNKITVEFYHSSLNLDDKQAINIINKLVNDVNNNIQKHTANSKKNSLHKIDTTLFNLNRDRAELVIIFTNILESIENNITEMGKYKSILVDVDLERMRTLNNINKRVLMETSDIFGNSYSSNILNTKIMNIERNIKDFKNSLLDLETSAALSKDNYNNVDPEKESTDNITLDGDIFNTILSIGGALQLNEFRLKTLTTIQNLQLKKNQLLTEKEILNLPFKYSRKDLRLEIISNKILELTEEVNIAIAQVYKFTQPKKAVHFLKNPEIVNEDAKLTSLYIKIGINLSLISFFFISFIAILLPRKN